MKYQPRDLLLKAVELHEAINTIMILGKNPEKCKQYSKVARHVADAENELQWLLEDDPGLAVSRVVETA